MSTNSDDGDWMTTSVASVKKLAIIVKLLLLIPFAVVRNKFGTADKISRLPGVSKGGGIISGITAAIFVFVAAGVVVSGGIVVTGGELPRIGGGEEPEIVDSAPMTPTSTPAPELSHTPTPTPIPTAEPTSTPESDPLKRFENNYRDVISYTLESESLTGVPILATEYRENDQGQTVLWLVFWECDEYLAAQDQWVEIGNFLARTAGRHEGRMPARVRLYSVTNLVNFEDTTTYINTSDARAVYNNETDPVTYTENWLGRNEIASQEMNETAYRMVVNESGQELANEAFYDDHVEVSNCPGPAEVGTASRAYDGDS